MNRTQRVRAYLFPLVVLSACAGRSTPTPPGHDDPRVEDPGSDERAACVSVQGSGQGPWYDVDVVGTEFDAYDGRRVRVIVALNAAANRSGVAEATISGGRFALAMPAVRSAAYTEIGVYVDVDDSGGCDVGEPLWAYTTPGAGGDIALAITPSQPAPLREADDCVMNGWFDVAERLPCSAE